MAIFKIGLLAVAPFLAMPLVTPQFEPTCSVADHVMSSDQSNQSNSIALAISNGSVIYKTESGFPDFMSKKSLPARPYPRAPVKYLVALNQKIAAL